MLLPPFLYFKFNIIYAVRSENRNIDWVTFGKKIIFLIGLKMLRFFYSVFAAKYKPDLLLFVENLVGGKIPVGGSQGRHDCNNDDMAWNVCLSALQPSNVFVCGPVVYYLTGKAMFLFLIVLFHFWRKNVSQKLIFSFYFHAFNCLPFIFFIQVL